MVMDTLVVTLKAKGRETLAIDEMMAEIVQIDSIHTKGHYSLPESQRMHQRCD